FAPDVRIGPDHLIGPHVRIGEGTVIESHVIIDSWTTIGRECRIWPGAKLGGPPQDRKYQGERTYLIIGDRNVIREDVTIHRATGEGNATRIGSDNMIMGYSRIGHNGERGSGVAKAK